MHILILIIFLHLKKKESQSPVINNEKTNIFGCICNPKKKSINDVSKVEFNKKCKQKQGKNSLDFIKSVDPTTLPPCSKVFLQQIKLECYVEYPYSMSYNAYPTFNLFPIGYGCKLSENG